MNVRQLLGIDADLQISAITNDSRECVEGSLYFAIRGLTVDGHSYIEQSIKNGAKVIVYTDDSIIKQPGIIYHLVADIHESYNRISADFYGNPGDELKVIGITGTNGKSTTSWIIDDLLNTKYACGYMGTIGLKTDGTLKPSPYTTLLPHQYNQIFRDMCNHQMEYAAIEVSSQGLDQHRVDFLKFDYGVMTNVTHEHLDYHLTMENYLQAKGKMFMQIKNDGLAIINNDDPFSCHYLKNNTTGKVVTYGIDNHSDIMAENVKLTPTQSQFTLVYYQERIEITTNLVGLFNIYNLLAAIAVVVDCGLTLAEVQTKSTNLAQVAGRMEVLANNLGLNVIVDYAHTPDGFEKVYEYINTIKTNRVISIFGSAGERDVLKRPILGEIADRYSDIIILTQEDCRNENPQVIANEVAAAIKSAEVIYIEDRAAAIAHGFAIAKPGDTIAVLAKGQEQYLKCATGKEFYQGDVQVCLEIINRKQ